MAKQNLGMVTAYAYAVVGGYEGTEAEFEALLGNIATDLEEIENLTVIANTLPEGSSATASYADGVLTLGIPKGDTGATGAGATATAGTTTTGDPGTNASVTNSGTTKDAVFNFTIPRGDTGNGIESIYLTGTSGAVKTYTILFTDGNTTTFDVTDGEVTNATLTAVLADYAKIDGYYESLGSGTADQLASNIYEEDSVPYNFRTSGGSIDIGDRETDMLVGGTVAWNQLVNISGGTKTDRGITATIDANGLISLSGVSDGGYAQIFNGVDVVLGHKYLRTFNVVANPNNVTFYPMLFSIGWTEANNMCSSSSTRNATSSGISGFSANIDFSGVKFKSNIFDITQMFGSTIADYIYSLEQANAGAGVAWFRKLFPKPYYAYNAGQLMSVNASSHDMVGFNQWDEEWEVGSIDPVTGENATDNTRIRCKNYIAVTPSTTYYIKSPNTCGLRYYDANKSFLGVSTVRTAQNQPFTVPSNCYYIRFTLVGATTYNHDICINISWDGERDGEYEAYVKHSYPLDDSLTLRGIPKLDASNNLYYDGDTYESDGTVTRKYGVVDLGTLSWEYVTTAGVPMFYAGLSDGAKTDNVPMICSKYPSDETQATFLSNDKVVRGYGSNLYNFSRVGVRDTAYTDAATFKTAMSGVYLVYELATPTTETAEPYTNPQIVDDFGTEEYVDYAVSQGDRDVSIPVGHYTQYMANLKAKLEMSPNSPEGAGDYIVRQTNGENEYVTLASNATIQDIIARLEALEGGGE